MIKGLKGKAGRLHEAWPLRDLLCRIGRHDWQFEGFDADRIDQVIVRCRVCLKRQYQPRKVPEGWRKVD